MLMFSGHIVGQQMCVGRNNGFFCLLLNAIWCLTGMKIILVQYSNFIYQIRHILYSMRGLATINKLEFSIFTQ
jgi:hypothetical protein